MKYEEDIKQTISLYSNSGWKKWFSKIRFKDAPYLEVIDLVPKKGMLVELGSGEGIFTNFMGITSKDRKVVGVEIDKTRFTQASRGIANVKFVHSDATTYKIPKCDAIVLFHLLHHLTSYREQEKLLKNCFDSLKKGGKLIIVEVNIKPTLKYLIAWLTDHLLVPWIFEKRFYSQIFFRRKNEWIELLKNIGFAKLTSKEAEKGKPFSHIILDCTK